MFAVPSQLAVLPSPGLLFGLMLVAAIVGGYVARLVRVPQVVGFLLGGVALRAVLLAGLDPLDRGNGGNLLQALAEPLKPIRDLALGLILFTVGSVFERSKLRAAGHRVLKISALEVGFVLLLVFVCCVTVCLLTQPVHAAVPYVVLAGLLAAAAVATAPAATLFVLHEYQAKGPTTDTILGLTALNNVACIVLFQSVFLTLASFGVIRTTGSVAGHLGWALLWSTAGSVGLGLVCGTAISIVHGKLPIAQALLFFFALFLLLGAGESWLWQHRGTSYSFLLAALVMGGTFANVAVDARKLESTLQTFAFPLFAAFFVIAGYQLHLANFQHMGWLGAGYVVARFVGKGVGCKLGLRWAASAGHVDGKVGEALVCQAAVVIGLASFVEHYWDSDLAPKFVTVVLGSVVVCELVGPLLVKRCAVRAGEVKALTLLRRPEDAGERGSAVRVTIQALRRLLGAGAAGQAVRPQTMRVEHIMRTNVQFIPASATFDEVLHQIERSTYSHFPVVREDGRFAGVIHFSDIRDVIYDPALSELVTAVDLADADAVTVPIDMPLPALLEMFTRHSVAVIPVVAKPGGKRVIGLVEQRDLLRAMHPS